ncbi:MAG: tetratricopeptide repeat protein [Saprospiraceae bacterium]
MMNYINQIDDFILNKLSPQEKEDFRQQLLKNAELAQEVRKRELVRDGLEALGNQKMKDRIKVVRKEMLDQEKNDNPPKNQNRIIPLWIMAAAAIFILGFVGWQFLNPTEITPEEIFAESYQPYMEDFGSRGTDMTKNYLQAGTYYNERNYSAAIPLLQNILEAEPQNSEVELVLGDCLLSINKTEEAMVHFNSILARKTNLYNDPAQWFLALSYLKQNEIEACKNALKNLIDNPRADYHEEAKELLSKLN